MNLLDANDQLGQYPKSWYEASANPVGKFTQLKGDIRVDVCIIGAGYSGLSTALHLAKKGKNICVIEAHRVGWGASGRNGGQLGSGQRVDQGDLENQMGQPKAQQLWQLAEQSKSLVKSLIKSHNIRCNLQSGIIHANHRARFNQHTKNEVRLLNEEYGYSSIQYLKEVECRDMIGSNAYFGGSYDTSSGHLHALNYALGLADAAKAEGANIFENTRALRIEEGTPLKIITEHGTITSDELVIACNGYLGNLMPQVAQRVMPINNFIVATEPLAPERIKALIKNNAAVADSKFVVNYFRISDDNRLLFGGRESYGYTFPPDIKSFVRIPMLEIFPQLHDVRLDYGWGGTLAITMNRMPNFSQFQSNIRSISGYSGHGVGMATLAGKLVADAICGEHESFEVFNSIPSKKFPGGIALRSPLLVLAMLYHSLLDKF